MPRALILYHFFHPDDVVSSRHFSDLASGLAERGWDVVAKPCNRGCRDQNRKYARFDLARNVTIRRVWRPRFPQSGTVGRFVNALWMISAWTFSLTRFRAPDVLIIGTDPILSVLVAIPWKLFRPKTKIIHWCFDLYPEAAIAAGALQANSAAVKWLQRLLTYAYRCCDLLLDIGPCMQELLSAYSAPTRTLTITPWALAEPSRELSVDARERKLVFGHAAFGLLYSGNFGRAHSYDEILELARAVRGKSIQFAFSVRGNRAEELRRAVSDQDQNIGFVPFAEETRLEARLSVADIHIVSLREEWTGSVVPSKFFGALAAGRPVLFVGSPRSSVARWIIEHRVGWVLHRENQSEIVKQLCRLSEHPQELRELFRHCHTVYQKYFSRTKVLDALADELCSIMAEPKREFSPTRIESVAHMQHATDSEVARLD
jgi:colanic acid biosynthesis glycosyl transferase WcaI